MKVAIIENAIVETARKGGNLATLQALVETMLVGENYERARGRIADAMAELTTEKPVKKAEKSAPLQAELPVEKPVEKARKANVRKAKTVARYTTHPLVRAVDGVNCPCNTNAGSACGGKVLANGFCATHGGSTNEDEAQRAKMRVS